MNDAPPDITRLLQQWRLGDRAALDALMPLVYTELHQLAGRCLRGQTPGQTLQTTALIHEAYLRLAGRNQPDWHDRAHFFAVAATIMRQILVDHARARLAEKRGGHRKQTVFEEGLQYTDEKSADLVALDDALTALAVFDERKSRILELRYFGGLTVDEAAEALGVSTATIGREARLAEAWLVRELTQNPA